MSNNPFFKFVSELVGKVVNFVTGNNTVGLKVGIKGDNGAQQQSFRDGEAVSTPPIGPSPNDVNFHGNGLLADVTMKKDGGTIELKFGDSRPQLLSQKFAAGPLLSSIFTDATGVRKALTYTDGHLSAYSLTKPGSDVKLIGTQTNGSYVIEIYNSDNPVVPLRFTGIGYIDKLVSHDGGGLIRSEGLALISNDGGGLISNDGGGLISNDGGGLIGRPLSSLIGNDGAGFISGNGAALIGNAGSTIISQQTAGVVASGGGNLVASGAGNFVTAAQLLAATVSNLTGTTRSLLSLSSGSGDDFQASTSTTKVIDINSIVEGDIEVLSDHDWFKVTLESGKTYVIDVKGADTSDGSLLDPHLRLYNASGNVIEARDQGGIGNNAKLIFDATSSGTYFIEAGGYINASSGTYRVSIVTGDEAPVINTNGGDIPNPIFVKENSKQSDGTPTWINEVTQVQATHVVGGGSGMTYSIVGGADKALFGINSSNGIVYFNNNPDFEQPGNLNGDNKFEVVVQAKYNANGLTDTQRLEIRLTDDENEPVIAGGTELTITLAENARVAQGGSGPWVDEVYTVSATAPVTGQSDITYAIVDGFDAAKFGINSSNGILYFKEMALPDFENPTDGFRDNIYEVVVRALHNTTGLYDLQKLNVKVLNSGSIVFDSPASFTINENVKDVAFLAAREVETGSTNMTWEVIGGEDRALFDIDATTGKLFFVQPIDYEFYSSDSTFDVQVRATAFGVTLAKNFSVTVDDVNEGPALSLADFDNKIDVYENDTGNGNYAIGEVVGYLSASDPENPSAEYPTVELTDSANGRFALEAGDWSFTSAKYRVVVAGGPINYETATSYKITIKATDADGISSFTDFNIDVKDGNDLPVFAPNQTSLSVAENTTLVHNFVATDADGDDITYSLRPGYSDNFLFDITADGKLSFKNTPDFENPDFGGSGILNLYEVYVVASDGIDEKYHVADVRVTNVYEGNTNPAIINYAGTNITTPEKTTSVTQFFANDPDIGDTLTWSLSGDDAARFTISSNGVFRFALPPDFENPADFDDNNVYKVTINLADNHGGSSSKAITVTVGDVVEVPGVTITGTVNPDTINSTLTVRNQPKPTANDDTINGLGGNDTIDGLDGDDTVKGGAGNDTLFGSKGFDLLDGEGDSDTVSYINSDASVFVSLFHNTANGGYANGDTLLSIENLTGSSKADALRGSDGNNRLDGGAGNDYIEGGLGDDTLIGGADIDRLSYTNADVGVKVSLNVTTAQITGGAGKDTISLFENLDGSQYADTLIGTAGSGVAANNEIYGYGGKDTISGLAGNDKIYGGAGDDTIEGGLGSDLLVGGNGDEVDGDTVTFALLGLNVTASLKTGTASYKVGTLTEIDSITLFENLTGSAVNDVLEGNSVANRLDGGVGIDTVSYASSGAGVTIDLWKQGVKNTKGEVVIAAIAQANGGDASGDLLFHFENVRGSGHNDTLKGNTAKNTLDGGGGDDILITGDKAVADVLVGGTGRDTLDYSAIQGRVLINLAKQGTFNALTGVITGATAQGGSANGDLLSSIEKVIGTNYDDEFTAPTSGESEVVGGIGSDSLSFAGSASMLINIISGTAGLHTFSGIEEFTGTSFNDIFVVDDQDDGIANLFDGGAGADTINYLMSGYAININLGKQGLLPTSITVGGTGGDKIVNFENVAGSALNDRIVGSAVDNILSGGGGTDFIDGGGADDTITGGAANDFLVGGLHGTKGDTVSYAGSADAVQVTLSQQATYNERLDLFTGGVVQTGGDAQGDRLSGFENVIGSGGGDTLTGNTLANVITGGLGLDTMTGGGGNDAFKFLFSNEGGDAIMDFSVGDKIQISKSGFGIASTVSTAVTSGLNSFSKEYFVSSDAGVATKSGHGQFIVDTNYTATERALLWDADGMGAGSNAVLIATFNNNYKLLVSDFVLI